MPLLFCQCHCPRPLVGAGQPGSGQGSQGRCGEALTVERCLFPPHQAMAALTDHPYASLTLPDDAAADCLFLRPGLPGVPPFLLHRGGGDLPNSQEVREGRSSTTTSNQRKESRAALVGGARDTFSRSLNGTTLSWLQGGASESHSRLPTPCPPCRHCRSSLTSPWYLCPAQNWRRQVLGSAPSAWCSAHAPTAESLALGS